MDSIGDIKVVSKQTLTHTSAAILITKFLKRHQAALREDKRKKLRANVDTQLALLIEGLNSPLYVKSAGSKGKKRSA